MSAQFIMRTARVGTPARAAPPWAQARRRGLRLTGRVAALLLALVLALGLGLAAPASPVRAEPVSAAFRQVAEAWLDGPESGALTDLAALAQAGDPAARLLLGLIDKTPALQGPWLSRLPRAERLALMRAPGGMSGRSWLAHPDGHPVAQAWRAVHDVGAGLDDAARLARLGEARAAREAVLALAARDRLDIPADWGWPDWMDTELAWLVWPRADDALRAALSAAIPPDHPQRALMGLPVGAEALAGWLTGSAAAAPLRAVCDHACPATRAACLQAAYDALGSHNALLTLGSPSESLIAQDDFLTTRRGRMAVLRRILLSADARGRRAQLNRARDTDICLGEVLTAEAARYRYIREGSEDAPTDD